MGWEGSCAVCGELRKWVSGDTSGGVVCERGMG